VTSFALYACQGDFDFVCIDSKRLELFFKVNNDYKILTIDEFAHFYQGIVVGDYNFNDESKYNHLIYNEINHSIAPLLSAYAQGRFKPQSQNGKYPEPFYLREADISQSKQANRQIEKNL
jgi:tRNA A37 threonylcarbamoyladenosine modification protein TsaB